MKDDNKNSDQGYQYPEGEYVVDGEVHPAEESAQAATAALPQPNMNMLLELWRSNKRVIIITASAFFVIMLFKIFSGHQTQEQAPVVVEPVQSEELSAPPTNLMGDSQMQTAMSAAGQNKAAVDELHTEVEQLKTAIDGINSSQAQFSNTLSSLSDQINQIQVSLASLQPKKAVIVKKAAPVVIPVTFYLRAIIPGRAWIQGSDSSSRSVAVGDTIRQYGVVQSIDAENGVVTTSSGKTIGFNSDDS